METELGKRCKSLPERPGFFENSHFDGLRTEKLWQVRVPASWEIGVQDTLGDPGEILETATVYIYIYIDIYDAYKSLDISAIFFSGYSDRHVYTYFLIQLYRIDIDIS